MSRPRKNNAEYFNLYKTLYSDPRIVALLNKFGMEGYGIYITILQILTDKDNFCIQLNDDLEWELLAGVLRTDCANLRQIAAEMIKLRLLQQNGDIYYSEDLSKQLSTVVDKREVERERAKSRTRDIQGQFVKPKPKKIVSAAETPQIIEIRDNIKENIQRKYFKYFEDNEFTELYDSYLEMRKQKKKHPTEKAEELILKKLQSFSLEEAKEMLRNSIKNNWTDVFEIQKKQESPPRNRVETGRIKYSGGYAIWKFGKLVDEGSGVEINRAYFPELSKY